MSRSETQDGDRPGGPAEAGLSASSPAAGAAPACLSLITLHLARCSEYPDGNVRHGYTLVAPLDGKGSLDARAWRSVRDRCAVRRFRPGEPDQHGHLQHRPGGTSGATWCLSFCEGEEEVGVHLQDHPFVAGAYVSFREADGQVRPFKVAAVRKVFL